MIQYFKVRIKQPTSAIAAAIAAYVAVVPEAQELTTLVPSLLTALGLFHIDEKRSAGG